MVSSQETLKKKKKIHQTAAADSERCCSSPSKDQKKKKNQSSSWKFTPATCRLQNRIQNPAIGLLGTEWFQAKMNFLICCYVMNRPELCGRQATGLLSVPGVRIKHGEAAFSYYEPHTWSKLQENCRSAPGEDLCVCHSLSLKQF